MEPLMYMDNDGVLRPLPKMNLLEQAFLTLLLPRETYAMLVAQEVLPRLGIIRAILVRLTMFVFFQPLMAHAMAYIDDLPSGGRKQPSVALRPLRDEVPWPQSRAAAVFINK